MQIDYSNLLLITSMAHSQSGMLALERAHESWTYMSHCTTLALYPRATLQLRFNLTTHNESWCSDWECILVTWLMMHVQPHLERAPNQHHSNHEELAILLVGPKQKIMGCEWCLNPVSNSIPNCFGWNTRILRLWDVEIHNLCMKFYRVLTHNTVKLVTKMNVMPALASSHVPPIGPQSSRETSWVEKSLIPDFPPTPLSVNNVWQEGVWYGI